MDWIPVKEAAPRLGYHPSHVRRLCANSSLRATKLGGQWIIDKGCFSGDPPSPEPFPYVSTDEVMERLGLSRFGVRYRIGVGRIEGAYKSPFRVWAIPRSAVDNCQEY